MDAETMSEELLTFFKALADENRLKIIGLLAQEPHSVEELAGLLGLGASTVSHHLSRLSRAGLVSARPEGHYFYYSLELNALQAMAARLLSEETLPRLSQAVDLDAYDRKVLAAFTEADGRIRAFPAQEKKFLVLLRHVIQAFEPGVRYSEKQVNDILRRFNEDVAALRRGLVEFKLMEREVGGGAYWRV